VYTNADSLRNKLDELKIRILNATYKPKVICITEFKVKNTGNSNIEMIEYNLEGYNLFHNNDTKNGHRGVLIYVDKGLAAVPMDYGQAFAENIFIRIKAHENNYVLLGCIYRSPNSTKLNNNALLELLDGIQYNSFCSVIIVGDFNLPDINWKFPSTVNTQGYSCEFIKRIEDNYLHQMVQEPTRGRAGQRSNILDLILTNEENSVDNIVYEAPLGKGDHSVINFRIKIDCEAEVPKTIKYLYDKANFEDMRCFLKEKDWETEMYKLSNVEEKWKYFVQTYTSLVEQFVPKREVKNTNNVIGTDKKVKHRPKVDFHILRTNENTDCGKDL